MLAYLTGGTGFVGTWLVRHLAEEGDTVVAPGPEIDVLSFEVVRADMASSRPDVVYHLAGLAHVGRSWDDPETTFRTNAVGTLNVLTAASSLTRPPRVVIVSSAEVYGPASSGKPLTELDPLRPVSPYAASKVAAEFAGVQAHLGRGLAVVCARPFNHVGPGQSDDFVVAALARRIVEAERDGRTDVRIGNLSAVRDFTDVRDVVRAYRLLALSGVPGEAYNVCSGTPVSIEAIARSMAALSTSSLHLVEDPELFRPVDVPILLGDNAKLERATGWKATVPLEVTLADVLESFRAKVP